MMFYIALGVSVLLFGFFAYMASRTWLVSHIVLLSFVFLFSLGFMVLAALTLRTQDAWRTVHDRLEQRLAMTTAELEALTLGDPADDETLSVPAAEAELGRLLIDRGRIWRGVRPVEAQGTGFVLSMADWGDDQRVSVGEEEQDFAADPAAEGEAAAAAGQPHGVNEGMIVHAFVEIPAPEALGPLLFGDSELLTERAALVKIPVAYVGRYKVTAQGEASITVEPLTPLDEQQLATINAGNATWALYEVLPQDSHEAYAGIPAESLPTLFTTLNPTEDAVGWLQAALSDFQRDQQPATENDPPDQQRVLVRFTQPHTVEVDFDDESGELTRSFDTLGRAVMQRLKQGEPTAFAEGDEVAFDYETANKLVAELGVAEFVDAPRIYSRPLRNYGQQLRQRRDQIADVVFETAQVQQELAAAQQANQLTLQQIAYRQAEITKLQEDQTQFEAEKRIVQDYLAALQQTRREQLQAMNETYRQNMAMRNELLPDGTLFEGARPTTDRDLATNR